MRIRSLLASSLLFICVHAHAQVIIDDSMVLGAPARYGLDRLNAELKARHITQYHIAIVRTKGRPESLSIRRRGNEFILGGSDDTGVMYALLEVARQLRLGTPLKDIKDATESPDLRDRAISVYTMNRAYWESRFYDEKYWARYLDMMAENRFNSLVVIFGYENGGFLAPCYPYFFNVDGYPDIRMVGLSEQDQQRNLAAIRRLIEMAHDRGIRFTAGIWDHIYRGGVQGGGIPGNEKAPDHPTPGLVWGVTAENLTAYTRTALTQFIRKIPVDAIQFRMHGESGLKKDEEEAFWADVFAMIKQTRPGLRIDMRAKELPGTVIESAIRSGIKFRIDTKVWMEQMGLPYHPTRINPEKSYVRHSYGDLLRYPKKYTMQWRLWTGGTSRILLWGDPEYARRMVGSAHLYDGDGLDVNEPLATKMEAQPHDARPFDLLQPQHRYYDYEFERYWHFFQVFGRMAYNPNTPSAVWGKEFNQRFGDTNGPLVEAALHRASAILPRIIASCYPYDHFPTTRGWAEKQALGPLPAYANAEGSDLCQFATFDEEARLLIDGGSTAKILPSANSQWFEKTAADVFALVDRVHYDPNKELASTLTDLRILANLALYHARRIPAAVWFRLYQHTHDPSALDSAIKNESNAIAAWRQIVTAAGDFYAYDLQMGVRSAGLTGHWKDELVKLEAGLDGLQQQRQNAGPADATTNTGAVTRSPVFPRQRTRSFDELFKIRLLVPDSLPAGQPITIRITASATAGMQSVRCSYRAVNQQLEYSTIEMTAGTSPGEYSATIPSEAIDPNYDIQYYIGLIDKKGNGRIYPDLNKETPYRIIRLIRPPAPNP
ncbi:MAG: hypothetical protein JST42_06605 [Bacteroidetes bacterium]|nr:hypothetical protein [Bacteroidota bacterium]